MKKLLVLLTLVVGLVGFTAGAFAQVGLPICNSCDKSPLGTLDCPKGTQGSDCQDYPFNYQTRAGYQGGAAYTLATTPYRAIFNICNCETADTSFVSGHRIGIRLTLLVNGVAGDNLGAYWADPLHTDITFGMYAESKETCTATAYLSLDRTFGAGKYYKADGVTQATPYSGTACVVASANRAVTYTTDITNGYTITDTDELNKLSRWWIILPEMRVDSNVVRSNDVISVRIETLDQATGGICATCVATCECVIDVAKMCPSSAPSISNQCLFPYFTSLSPATGPGEFWNGIVITNTGSATGTATLTVYQQDGKTGTFQTTIAGRSLYVAALENIEFVGTGLGGQAVYINVTTDFPMDGFAFMSDSTFGDSMGYLCRKQ